MAWLTNDKCAQKTKGTGYRQKELRQGSRSQRGGVGGGGAGRDRPATAEAEARRGMGAELAGKQRESDNGRGSTEARRDVFLLGACAFSYTANNSNLCS